mmetsp:Transcript_847/g.1910  ORF Transcript_847/g.1910 Transcript_847/m.1910 type:complete len:493 (+) Transcript_847:808-2286(+)
MHPYVLELMRKEMDLLRRLDHPHIVKLYEYSEDTDRQQIVLLMEYLPGGDCLALLRRSGGVLDEAVVARLISQVLLSLSYCHAQGVLHRDVKPENMMLSGPVPLSDFGWSPRSLPDCKLIDFGLASARGPGGAGAAAPELPEASREFLGTPPYMAPETIRCGCGHSTKTDIWSTGVTALELLSGVNPFGKPADHGGEIQPIFDSVRRYAGFEDLEGRLENSPGWGDRGDEAGEFLLSLMSLNPEDRPEAAEALEHGWLEEHKEPAKGITGEMLRGLASYASAPLLARYCLYIVAARLSVPDAQRFGAAFLRIDGDCDGRISRQELAEALEEASHWWGPTVHADEVFQAADLSCSGGLSFTEFVAACLCARHNSLDDLITCAFDALDDDRDGLVRVQDIRALFGECEFPLLHRLPQDRAFTMDEWFVRFTGRHLAGRLSKPRSVKPQGLLDRVLDRFSCTTTCTPFGRREFIIAPTERLTAPSPPVCKPVPCT